jgi:putative ABC transport system substrate-binding protein
MPTFSIAGHAMRMRVTLPAVTAVMIAVLAGPLTAGAQPPAQHNRIGFLAYDSCGARNPTEVVRQFSDALAVLGYVQGKHVTIDCRVAGGAPDDWRIPAQDLVASQVDLIVAQGTPATLAAKSATRTIPIIMFNVADPVARGLVASLAAPGVNVTGLANLAEGQTLKGFDLLQEAFPDVARVAVLTDLSNDAQAALVGDQDRAARLRGLKLQRVDVRSIADLDAAFAAVLREHAQALYLYPLRIPRTDAARVIEFAVKHRLPTMAAVSQAYLQGGVLLFHSHSLQEQYSRLATYVDRVLNGAKPSDLPVERPTKFDLVINLKTARAMGLTIPESLLLRADRVIK